MHKDKEALFKKLLGSNKENFPVRLLILLFSLLLLLYILYYIIFFRLFLFVTQQEPVNILFLPFSSGPSILLTLISIALVFILHFVLTHYYKNKILSGKEMKYTLAENQSFGSSRWMSRLELEKDSDLDYKPLEETKGILLGSLGEKAVSQKPEGGLNKNIMVCGLAGSGKSTGFIIPYIYQAVKLGESVVAIDTKGDIYSKTAVYAASHGYEIKVLNCRNPKRSDGWDILKPIGTDVENVKRIAATIFDCTKSSDEKSKDDFWRNGSLLLFEALIMYVKVEEEKRQKANKKKRGYKRTGTIGQVYNLLVGYKMEEQANDYIKSKFEALAVEDPHHPALPLYKAFNSATKDEIKNSIIQNLAIKISCFEGQEIQKLLGMDEIDLLTPALKKCIYYVNLSEQNHMSNFIASMFFRELSNALVTFADAQENKACPVPVTLLLDEFGAIGKIPNFDDFIAGSRSRAIRCVIAYQNIDQIIHNYGYGAQTIIANCETWISMGVNDLNTARLFSRSIGDATIEVVSRTLRKNTPSSKRADEEYSKNKSFSKRALLDESELMRQNKNDVLVLINRKYPLLLEKLRCWEMKEYNTGEHYNIEDYPNQKEKLEQLSKENKSFETSKKEIQTSIFGIKTN